MRLAPDKWTYHHTHRLYHMSALAIWIFLLGITLYGMTLAFWQSRAFDVTDTKLVAITATVGSITPQPTVIGGGGNYEPPQKVIASPSLQPSLTLTVAKNIKKQLLIQPGKPQKEYAVFETQFPSFSGQTNIPYALIFLEVHSDLILRSTITADGDGNWSWAPTEPISPGFHTLTATVTNPSNSKLVSTTSFEFYVALGSDQTVQNPAAPIRLHSGGYVASTIDVVINIPAQSRSIQAGDELSAQVRLIRAKPVEKPADIPIQYIVQDAQKKNIMEVEETLTMVNELSIIKAFNTAVNLPAGKYTIIAQVPSDTFIASSSEFFEVNNPSSSGAAGTTDGINPHILFQIMFGLTLFFGAIGYFEYRRFVEIHNQIKQISEADLSSMIQS